MSLRANKPVKIKYFFDKKLNYLIFRGSLDLIPVNYKQLLAILMPLNIQARYPYDKDELVRQLTRKVCKDIYKKTEGFSKWIKTLMMQ